MISRGHCSKLMTPLFRKLVEIVYYSISLQLRWEEAVGTFLVCQWSLDFLSQEKILYRKVQSMRRVVMRTRLLERQFRVVPTKAWRALPLETAGERHLEIRLLPALRRESAWLERRVYCRRSQIWIWKLREASWRAHITHSVAWRLWVSHSASKLRCGSGLL